MKKFSLNWAKALMTVLMLGMIACGKDKDDPTSKDDPNSTEDPVAVTGVSISPASLTLNISEKQTLTATVTPEAATNKNVAWSSSNAVVAAVDAQTGEVTAAAAGNAVITVTTENGSKTATCAVTVAAPAKITLQGYAAQVLP